MNRQRQDRGVARTQPPSRETPEDVDGRYQPAEHDEEPKPLGQESPEILEDASHIGEKRLERSPIGDSVTAFIGGMSICFGVIATAWAAASLGDAAAPSPAHLVGALAYPVGFVILLIGKSELFTENFLLPVTGVIEGDGHIGQLLGLWGRSLVFNLAGTFVFALLISRPGVVPEPVADNLRSLGEHVVGYDFWTAFVKAIFAGWLMTMLTWLLLAAHGIGPRLFIIWVIGTLIILGEFAHLIISGAEVFMALLLGGDVEFWPWMVGSFPPILLGNVLGGVVFVTLLQWVQVQYESDGD